MSDYAPLYRHSRGSDQDENEITRGCAIIVKVKSEKFGVPCVRRHYRLFGDGELLFRSCKTNGVLPHLERTINRRVTVRHDKFLQLHAASLSWQGRGVIFASKSSCGKTTLAMALLSRGW